MYGEEWRIGYWWLCVERDALLLRPAGELCDGFKYPSIKVGIGVDAHVLSDTVSSVPDRPFVLIEKYTYILIVESDAEQSYE